MLNSQIYLTLFWHCVTCDSAFSNGIPTRNATLFTSATHLIHHKHVIRYYMCKNEYIDIDISQKYFLLPGWFLFLFIYL